MTDMYFGKVPENIVKLSILKQLHSKNTAVIKGADLGEDCALFSFNGKLRPEGRFNLQETKQLAECEEAADGTDMDKSRDAQMLAVCVQEAAVAVKADIGKGDAHRQTMESLIVKCANNLAVGGAVPVAAMITLLLPEDTDTDCIRTLMSEADEACGRYGMQIAGGQTKVMKEINAPVAVINAYGETKEELFRTASNAKPGQDIVLSKWAALQGTAVIASLKAEQIGQHYPAYLAEEASAFDKYLSIAEEAETALKNGVCAMHDASEGGILAALWELAEGAGVGLDIDIKKIPLRQETVEICECVGVNPYELLSGGCLVMTADDGEGLVRALNAENIPAVVIGRTTSEKARIIRNEDEVRYMDRPKQDEIYRII
jgi:hydrogenase maturation factor